MVKKTGKFCSHDDNRKKVCLVGLKKGKNMFIITNFLNDRIKKFIPLFDESDEKLPIALCKSCDKILYLCEKNNKRIEKLKVPNYFELKFKRSTRFSDHLICECTVCEIARNPGEKIQHQNLMIGNNKSLNLGVASNGKIHKKKTDNSKKICIKCCGIKKKGKGHKCKKSYSVKNIINEIIELHCDEKQKEMICAALVKKTSKKGEHSGKNGKIVSLHQQGTGRKLNVIVKPNLRKINEKPVCISAESVIKIQTKMNLSDQNINNFTKFMRQETKNRNLFEPNVREKLVKKSKELDNYFGISQFDVTEKKKKIVKIHENSKVIHCTKMKELINLAERERSILDSRLIFGIDGGGGFLKFCLSVTNELNFYEEEESSKKRMKYDNSVADKDFKNTGVKRLFIIAIMNNCQENYANLSQIWKLLNLNDYYGIFSVDLKVANIIVGLQAHASSFPCTWCDARKTELDKCGNYRTIKDCLDNFNEWTVHGKKDVDAGKFKNCKNPPLFVNRDENQEIIDIVVPPELHLMIGVVNKLYDHMFAENKEISEQWAKKCNVQRDKKTKKLAFNGNSCRELLRHVDVLRSISSIETLKYVDTFSKFNLVVDSCFSLQLKDDFKKHINDFRLSYV